MSNGGTTLGLPERWERTLIYPLSLLAGLFIPGVGWLIAWLIGLLVYFFEKNRNVRWHALQAMAVFGPLSILLALVKLISGLLGWVPVIGFLSTLGLGLLGFVIFWIMIILAVYLTVMAFFRPTYRLPFVANLIDRWV
jgi:uncharacterized membrane protein